MKKKRPFSFIYTRLFETSSTCAPTNLIVIMLCDSAVDTAEAKVIATEYTVSTNILVHRTTILVSFPN